MPINKNVRAKTSRISDCSTKWPHLRAESSTSATHRNRSRTPSHTNEDDLRAQYFIGPLPPERVRKYRTISLKLKAARAPSGTRGYSAPSHPWLPPRNKHTERKEVNEENWNPHPHGHGVGRNWRMRDVEIGRSEDRRTPGADLEEGRAVEGQAEDLQNKQKATDTTSQTDAAVRLSRKRRTP